MAAGKTLYALLKPVLISGLFFAVLLSCGAQEKPVKKEENTSSASVQASSAPSETGLYETEKAEFVKIVRNIPFKVKSSKLYLKDSNYKIDEEYIEAYLDSKLTPALKKLLDVLPPGKKVVVEGYASATGTEEPSKGFIGNKKLSRDRAQAVINYLDKKTGLDKDKLIIKFYGADKTIPGIDPKDDRNCRVTITILE